MASEGLFPIFTTQFSTLLELKLQQQGSLLRSLVREGAHVGKMASPMQQMAAVASRAPAGRFAPMARVDQDFTRRWVFPIDKELPQMFDTFDELRTIVDPKGEASTNAANAFGRDWDDEIIRAAFGTAQIGQDANGLSAETFSTSTTTQQGGFVVPDNYGASTAVGLTVAKLIELKRAMRHFHNNLDLDPPTLIIGSQQEADLLGQVQVVSTEFSDHPVLVDGNLKRFLGFNVIVSERIGTIAATTGGSAVDRRCIAFVRSGLYLGIWRDMTNRISIRNDLSGEPYQLYSMHTFGATRTQPGKVFEVDCLDATGADITP